jgi:PAS domain S-box-containing protein
LLSRNKLAAGGIVLLAAFMGFIVWNNYRSQVELRRASLDQFADYAAKEASSLANFFSERKNDLDDLSASREIRAYFDNKALGMSREYGLWASQVSMSELFSRFVAKKSLEGKRIYRRIAFVDREGELLADNWGVPDNTVSCGLQPPALLTDLVEIKLVEGDGGIECLLKLSYEFKGLLAGTLVAWLNTDEIMPTLMHDLKEPGEEGLCFLKYKDMVYSPLHFLPPRLVEIAGSEDFSAGNGMTVLALKMKNDSTVDYLAVRSPVEGTPFLLVNMVPERQVLGSLAPWRSLLYTLLLALLLLGGGFAILRISARNLILNVQVAEAGKNAQRIEEKNRQLEQEVLARQAAEAALRKVNDELEDRVGRRTRDLEERTEALSREVAERREAESVMRYIFNNTHDAILIHRLDGEIVDVNERMLELFQVSRKEALTLSIVDDFSAPGSDKGFIDNAWERVVAGEEIGFEWVSRRPHDGQTFDTEVLLYRVEMGGEDVIFASVHDISEQKQREIQQEEHQEFLNTIFEGIGAAIFVFDPEEGRTVDCNAVGERLLSMKREELLDSSCHVEFPFEGKRRQDLLCPELHDRDAYEEGILFLGDGSTIPVSLHTFDVFIGGKAHLVQVVFDIADRKTLERKLNIAQKLESIGQLASGIAHEINTPIQYVGDSIHFVKEALGDLFELIGLYEKGAGTPAEADGGIAEFKDDMDYEFVVEEMPKACDRALEGVKRVASIVQAMKNFSHHGEEEAKLVDINKAIENTVMVTRNEWKYAADIETDLAPELPMVHCFPGGINQVLLNIIINAGHAIADSEKDGERGNIAISTRPDGEFVEIRIADSGCGIPKENLIKVFDPFFTTKEVGKGTGQGLAIVHDIVVEKHGGTIDIDSEVGVGTTFTIRLPVAGPPE